MPEAIQLLRIVLEPTGPLANLYVTLEQALDSARALEAAGHTIRSIIRGPETIEGPALREALGEVPASSFVAFPASL